VGGRQLLNLKGVIYLASTNKTANLGLNQWEAMDAVEMVDFNADNVKIDAAVGELRGRGESPWVKLDEKSYSSHAYTYMLDLSGIDIDEYIELIFRLDVSGIQDMFMEINGKFDNVYNVLTPGASASAESRITMGRGVNRLSISQYCMVHRADEEFRITTMSRHDFPKVSTIKIGSSNNAGFRAGEGITVWGLKR